MMVERGAHVEGTDLSQVAVERAMAKGIPCRQVDLDCEPLPFADNSYGTVVSNSAIEHRFFSEKSLAECIRVLKPGGKLVVCLPNTAHWICRLWLLFGRFPYVRNSPHRRDAPALLHRARSQGCSAASTGLRSSPPMAMPACGCAASTRAPSAGGPWRPSTSGWLASTHRSSPATSCFVCRKEGQAVMSIGRQVSHGVFWVGISTMSSPGPGVRHLA